MRQFMLVMQAMILAVPLFIDAILQEIFVMLLLMGVVQNDMDAMPLIIEAPHEGIEVIFRRDFR